MVTASARLIKGRWFDAVTGEKVRVQELRPMQDPGDDISRVKGCTVKGKVKLVFDGLVYALQIHNQTLKDARYLEEGLFTLQQATLHFNDDGVMRSITVDGKEYEVARARLKGDESVLRRKRPRNTT